jgi:outer membrane protein assembly factor BamB
MKRFLMGFQFVLIVCLLAAFATGSAATVAPASGSNWPQWRGPESQGVSSDKNLPTEWSETKNIQWKSAIPGRGHSSPIVWENRIFLTTAIEGETIPGAKAVTHYNGGQEFKHPDAIGADRKQTLKVLCLDRDSGKILWERVAFEGKVFDDRHKKGSFASSTPVTDGRHVYAYFGPEGLYCYDFNGKEVWKKAIGGIATLGLGTATSPVLYENLVILQCDEDEGKNSFIIALDKITGKDVWRVPRKVQVSWSTPVLVKSGNRAELVTCGTESIIAYDPATGKEIWRCKGVESNAIPSPVVGHGMVVVSAGFPAKRAFAIKLGGSGDLTGTPNIAWKYEKGTAYVPSPILYGDYIYLVTDRGILTCLDAKTGQVKYEGGRVPVPATFTASPVAYDGKVLLTSEDGETFVIKAGPVHEVVRTNSVGEPVYASPAIASGKLFVRGEKHLFCIANK